jgi:hypothetical protein
MVNCFLAALVAALPPLALAAPALQIPFKQNPHEVSSGISKEVFAELEGFAKLAAIASSPGSVSPFEEFPGLEIVERWDDVGLRGYVAIDDNGAEGEEGGGRIVVVFDGDYDFADALADEVAPSGAEAGEEYQGGVIHAGTQKAWEAEKETVNRVLDDAMESSGYCELELRVPANFYKQLLT